MDKDQLTCLFERLQNIQSEFNDELLKSRIKSTAPKRNKSLQNAGLVITRAKQLIEEHQEIIELIKQICQYDEFYMHRYFNKELTKLLNKIQELTTSPE